MSTGGSEYQTALEYYSDETDDETVEPDHPYAKQILWLSQRKFLYVCETCCSSLEEHSWSLSDDHHNYDEYRREAYRILTEESPECDVCASEPEAMENLREALEAEL